MKTEEFITKDLYLAGLMYAKGVKFERIDREGKQCWFVFEDKGKCQELQQQYFSKEIEVNAKEYTDAIKTLKNLVFEN